jgi:hypothetical protein
MYRLRPTANEAAKTATDLVISGATDTRSGDTGSRQVCAATSVIRGSATRPREVERLRVDVVTPVWAGLGFF